MTEQTGQHKTGLTLRLWGVAILSLSLIFAPLLRAQGTDDVTAPQVRHELIKDTVAAGESLTIAATVTDDAGVGAVALFYRHIGSSDYERVFMTKIKETAMYSATIPAESVQDPGIEYYIEATDTAGNALLRGFSYSPLIVSVAPPAAQSSIAAAPTTEKKPSGSKTWLWVLVGVGVAAAAAVAASSGGGGSDDGGGATGTGNVIIGGGLPN
ncbi:MAG: hypothetical protein ACR2RB_08855 [Gammaproteobacteria bacterium]